MAGRVVDAAELVGNYSVHGSIAGVGWGELLGLGIAFPKPTCGWIVSTSIMDSSRNRTPFFAEIAPARRRPAASLNADRRRSGSVASAGFAMRM
jgi:hypothetical protein